MNFDDPLDISQEYSYNKLLLILSAIVFLSLSPYFIWEHQLNIFRIAHLTGNLLIIYVIINYNNYKINNFELVTLFFIICLYTMVAGTEVHKFTYITLLPILYITLRPDDHLRVFNYLVTCLTIVYAIGLLSYLLSTLGLNIQISEAIAPNDSAYPYIVYFGHIKQTLLPVYRFSSVFDEAGVVGTLSGLILSSIGISRRNIKSIIILLAGLISFSLAFYIMLLVYLLFNLNLKKILFIVPFLIIIIYFSGNKFDELIGNRIAIRNGQLAGDNRTEEEFDNYYKFFIEKGGNDLTWGKGFVKPSAIEGAEGVSSYKLSVIRYGIIGVSLIICFYALCVLYYNNSFKGWFLFLIFTISSYQRPDLLDFYNIVLFLGGLQYLNMNSGDI